VLLQADKVGAVSAEFNGVVLPLDSMVKEGSLLNDGFTVDETDNVNEAVGMLVAESQPVKVNAVIECTAVTV